MSLKEAIIVLIFLIFITLVFFYKIFFGLIPLPTDLIVGAYYPWLEFVHNGNLGIPIHNSLLSDAVSIIYPLKILAVDLIKKGELPLWNSFMFGGYPLLASVQLGLAFPTMIFYFLFSSPIAWTIQVISQPLLGAFFMYLLLRHLKLEKLSAIFGGIAFGFGGFISIWMQWNTQSTTALFLPILILLEDKYLFSKEIKWGVLLSIFLCLQVFAGYLPIISFTFIALVIWYLFKSKQFIKDLKILFFIILGFSLSSIVLLPVIELISVSQRLFENLNINDALVPPESLIRLISPDFFGSYVTANFWGRDAQAIGMYTGIVTIIFSIIGIKQYWIKDEVKFAFILLLITFIVSIFNPVGVFLYQLGVWGNNSLTMNKTFFLINFSLSILGAFGISSIKNHSKLNLKSSVWILSTILGLFLGLLVSQYLLIKSQIFIPISVNDIENALKNIKISLRNLILPFLLTISVSILIVIWNKFNRFDIFFKLIFIFILVLDLFYFGHKFNTFSIPNYLYPETPISQFLEKYPNERIVAENDVFPANMWVPFKLSSITGYDGIYPLNISQLLASANSGKVDVPPQTRWGLLTNFDSKIINETNTRFLVAVKRNKNGEVSENGRVDSKIMSPRYKEIFSIKGVTILENTQSIPRVYLTKRVINLSEKDTLKLMLDDKFAINDISLSDFAWNSSSTEKLQDNLVYKQIMNSHIQIDTSSNIDAYLVVLDSYYPGWKVFIDGKETLIHKTNYNFRGIILPKGSHTVDFIYDPQSSKYGALISGISLIIIISLLIVPKIIKRL